MNWGIDLVLSVRSGDVPKYVSVIRADTGAWREGAAWRWRLRHDCGMTADLLARARNGDADAFGELVGPHRRELEVHCYRILGSVSEAEDVLQEALLAAWQGLGGFEGRASVRTWLYRIATTRSLNALRAARRRPQTDWPPPGTGAPEPTRLGETPWLEPCPDTFLEGLADGGAGPDARYEASEAISLAFITALQKLPPRQRAVLILRDVLDFPGREVGGILGTTEESVKSALKRARATLQRQLPPSDGRDPPPPPGSAAERNLVNRLTRAYASNDVNGLVALLTEDVLMTMPPIPLEYLGRDLVAQFLRAAIFRPGATCRPVPTRANGQPALAMYVLDQRSGIARASGVLVFALSGSRVSAITRFDDTVLPRFGFPATLPG
jgi:RNA polymerase sigma-70 factor (TIGR02960 family)